MRKPFSPFNVLLLQPMKNMKVLFTLGLTAGCLISALAQDCNEINKKDQAAFEARVNYLASDALEGREAGTDGEIAARDYIAAQMKAAKLEPRGSEGYFQSFEFQHPVEINTKSTYLSWGTLSFGLNKNFYPTKFSSNATTAGKAIYVGHGIYAPDLGHSDYGDNVDYKNKVFIMDIGSPDGTHPHSKFRAYQDIQKRLEYAKELGAVGVVLYNTDENADDPESSYKNIVPVGMPVVFWSDYSAEKRPADLQQISLSVDQKEVSDTGYNVVGYLDRGSDKTIVIGAHYDHLGYGGEGSRHTGGPEIHNGADDNASGTAGLLALADYYAKKGKKFKGNNYLFIAFSAEEKGLLGSKYFVENPTISLNGVNYMINYDMIGSLDVKDGFIINGVGTSPKWKESLDAVACNMKFTTTASGIGPSDHTSFYLKKIPSIHFFTGGTEYYHKPSDDPQTLNMVGAMKIVEFTKALINGLDDQAALPYAETTQEESMRVPKFKVTLGVMPDYSFEGPGMKIDGIIPDRPAQGAGLRESDIILQIGDMNVTDMQGYMRALSAFNKGDEVTIRFIRNGKEGATQLTF